MSVEQLWAAWRHDYVTEASAAERAGVPGDRPGIDGCVFCRILETGDPSPDNLIVWRDELSWAVLNLFPYATAHLLVMPVRHQAELGELSAAESVSLWETARRAHAAITAAYEPDGANLGANLGRAGGAGIPRHLHLHVLPRWNGDTNFMTAIAGVRVMPESLADTWEKLHRAWPVA